MLVDTSVLIDCVRLRPPALNWLRALPEQPWISVMSITELFAGARTQKEERDIQALLGTARVLSVTSAIAEHGGSILRHYHRSHGVEIADAIIAATAVHHSLELATLNTKHFPMFPKLKRPY